ncbi:unnamed protein product [Cuscuta europaea]|uniref:Uncharacterized protein n=1 Tax=Cuscuta europaea TaxID=41803 RepID=A0A9P1EFL5_CUSEU|nr:unnamed protein product [Cuscuta europaea]
MGKSGRLRSEFPIITRILVLGRLRRQGAVFTGSHLLLLHRFNDFFISSFDIKDVGEGGQPFM